MFGSLVYLVGQSNLWNFLVELLDRVGIGVPLYTAPSIAKFNVCFKMVLGVLEE